MYNRNETIKKALIDSLPVLAGYILIGIGFGIILQSHGYGIGWAVAMSVLVYAGSLQYVAIDLISGGASLITTAVTALMVNARHLFYAISMLKTYRDMGKAKAYLAFALTDEVYSLVCTIDKDKVPDGVSKKAYCIFLSLFCQCYWVVGSAMGSLIGAALPFELVGIDFAMTALFTAVLVEQWLSGENRLSAVTGAIVSILCLLAFGPDNFLIPTMVLITIALTVEKKFGLMREEVHDV